MANYKYSYQDERGEFHAFVEDSNGNTIWEVHYPDFYEDEASGELVEGSTIFDDGYMKNVDDTKGLESHLKSLGTLQSSDKLYAEHQMAEGGETDSNTFEKVKVTITDVDMGGDVVYKGDHWFRKDQLAKKTNDEIGKFILNKYFLDYGNTYKYKIVKTGETKQKMAKGGEIDWNDEAVKVYGEKFYDFTTSEQEEIVADLKEEHANKDSYAEGGIVASSSTLEGIKKIIGNYYYSSNISLQKNNDSDEYEVHNAKGKINSVKVIQKKGRFQFINVMADGGGVSQFYNIVYEVDDSNAYHQIKADSSEDAVSKFKSIFPNTKVIRVDKARFEFTHFASGGSLETKLKKKLSETFELPMEMAVYVPSTQKANEIISKKEFNARIEEVETYLSNLFGGYSATSIDGGYMSDDKDKGLIQEDVARVTSFGSKDGFDEKFSELINKIVDWCGRWSQESIGFEFEGDMFYISKDAKFKEGGTINRSAINVGDSVVFKDGSHSGNWKVVGMDDEGVLSLFSNKQGYIITADESEVKKYSMFTSPFAEGGEVNPKSEDLQRKILYILVNEVPKFNYRVIPKYNNFMKAHELIIYVSASDKEINNVRGQYPQVVSLLLNVDTMELRPQVFGGNGGRNIYREPDMSNPNEKYYAMISIKIPFRTPKPDEKSVLSAIKKFVENYKKLLKENVNTLTHQKMVNYKELLSDSNNMARGGSTYEYETYHKTLASALDEAERFVNRRGYEFSEDKYFPDLTMGGVGYGHTASVRRDVVEVGGKHRHNVLLVQIYRMDSGTYELNMYFGKSNYADGGENDVFVTPRGGGFDQYGNPYGFDRSDETYYTYDGEHYTEEELIDFADTMAHYDKQDSGELIGINNLEDAIKFLGEDEVEVEKMAEGGIVDKNGLIYALQNDVSAGTIAGQTYANTYDEVAEVRHNALEILYRDGDKPYSLDNLIQLLKKAEKVDNRSFASVGRRQYAEGGSITNSYNAPFRDAEDIWDAWTIEQREHFLSDHAHEFPNEKFSMLNDSFDRQMTYNDVAKYYDYTQLPFGVRQSIVEHIIRGQYAEGGSIPNNYENLKDEEVWDMWSNKQKEHFLADHHDLFKNISWKNEDIADLPATYRDVARFYYYDDLPKEVKYALRGHIVNGQYAEGGETDKQIIELRPIYTIRDKQGFRFYSTEDGKKLYAEKNNDIYEVNEITLKPSFVIPLQRSRFKFVGLINDSDVKDLNPLHYERETQKRIAKSFGMAEGGETDEYAKGGNVPSIEKRVAEVNALIKEGNDKGLKVVDESNTWQTPMKYNELKYSNGVLYVSLIELDLYKHNKGMGSEYKSHKFKVTKNDTDYGFGVGVTQRYELSNIARMYRKAINHFKNYGYAEGGDTQGYDDREDERLGMEDGRISGKDFVGTHEQREHSRRDDARFEERMAKGGETKDNYRGKSEQIKKDLRKIKSGVDGKPPYVFEKDGFIYVSAEEGDGYADYYKYYINKDLEKVANKYGTFWEWEDAGSIMFAPEWNWDMKMGGVTFDDKVASISKALLSRKKVSPSVQKDYGKTYDKKEAIESAKRIAGAMRKKKN